MRLLGKSDERGGGEMQTRALVVHAEAAPQGAPLFSRISRATVQLLVDAGSGPISVSRSFDLDKDQWLVAGMEVPVAIDPKQPDRFEVDWDAIPSIEERAAGNDPTLTDPIGAQRKVVEALEAAGLAEPDPNALPDAIGGPLAKGREAREAATPDRFREALERAAREPAPPGKRRAVVLISAIRARIASGKEGGAATRRVTEGKCNAVLSVNVPGRAPYALYQKKFDIPRGRGDVTGAGLPAVVSADDPSDVEVLWDELPSLESQIGQRISDRLQGLQAEMRATGELEGQMAEAVQRAAAQGPGPVPGIGQLSPEMQAVMARNAKMALQFTRDPAQRKLLIEQYRLAGIPIEEEEGT